MLIQGSTYWWTWLGHPEHKKSRDTRISVKVPLHISVRLGRHLGIKLSCSSSPGKEQVYHMVLVSSPLAPIYCTSLLNTKPSLALHTEVVWLQSMGIAYMNKADRIQGQSKNMMGINTKEGEQKGGIIMSQVLAITTRVRSCHLWIGAEIEQRKL